MKADDVTNSRYGLISCATLGICLACFRCFGMSPEGQTTARKIFWFLGAVNLHLVASACVFIEGRTWKRWLLLLLVIPCVLILADRLIIVTKVLTSL
jgi:hypothetical protein